MLLLLLLLSDLPMAAGGLHTSCASDAVGIGAVLVLAACRSASKVQAVL
jgi:hypothetical protein